MPNVCHVPPGRLEAIRTRLPIIPPGEWAYFQRHGRWTPGIQAGLEQTAGCPWVDDMAQVRLGAVVVRRRVVPLYIRGAFPWGWYRFVVEPSRPVDPVATLDRFVQVDPLDSRELSLRTSPNIALEDRLVDPLEGRRLELGGATGALVTGCDVVPVPTIDLLVPYPMTTAGASPENRMGALGQFVVRVPGSDHPLFSTGLGIAYITREFLSPEGLAMFDEWDRRRRTSLTPVPATPEEEASGRWASYRELSWLLALFGENVVPSLGEASAAPYQWWTRDYAVSHMQCLPQNHHPRDAGHESAGTVGDLVGYRWRLGGAHPAPYEGIGWDVYEEAYAVAPDLGGRYHFDPAFFIPHPSGADEDGMPYLERAPESPLGFKNTWQGRLEIVRPWNGPPPGTFAE